MDDRPEIKYLNEHVKQRVCASGSEKWFELGTELLDKKHIAALSAVKSDVTECTARCSKMFELWLERQPEASWRHLIRALQQIHMNTLASDIEKLFSIEQKSEVVTTTEQILQSGQQAHQPSLDSGMFTPVIIIT